MESEKLFAYLGLYDIGQWKVPQWLVRSPTQFMCNAMPSPVTTRAACGQSVKRRSPRMNLQYLSDCPEPLHLGNNDLTHRFSIIRKVFDGLKETLAIITSEAPV